METKKANPQQAITPDLSHRLTHKGADISNIGKFSDTADNMISRAKGVIHVVALHCGEDQTQQGESMYYALQAALNELEDLNAVIDAYVKSQRA